MAVIIIAHAISTGGRNFRFPIDFAGHNKNLFKSGCIECWRYRAACDVNLTFLVQSKALESAETNLHNSAECMHGETGIAQALQLACSLMTTVVIVIIIR